MSIDYIVFELNYGYYFHVFYKKDIDLYSIKSKSVNELITKLKKLMII